MITDTIEIVSKVIHAKYKSSQLTKKDIAEKTNLALNTINNAITGKNMTLNSMLLIMDALGMNMKDLVDEAEKLGLKFPKPGAKPVGVNVPEVKKLLDQGQSTMQVAAKIGVEEKELKEIVQASSPEMSMFEIK